MGGNECGWGQGVGTRCGGVKGCVDSRVGTSCGWRQGWERGVGGGDKVWVGSRGGMRCGWG